MKTPKAKKLPSGSWFVRVRVNGQDIGITKDTEKAAVAEAMAIKAGIKEARKTEESATTLREAIDQFIEQRRVSLSPATIKGYRLIQKNRFQSIMDWPISKLSDADFQRAINLEAKRLNAKTTRNSWSFLATVLREITVRSVRVSLPHIVREERPFLQPEQIPVFLDACRGRKHEIGMLLCLHGLRASEVLDVRWDDIDLDAGTITVHGAAVLDENRKLVHKKANKIDASRRTVPILIDQLADAVRNTPHVSEYVCPVSSGAILYQSVNRTCRAAGLPEVGAHGLRHSFASLAFHLGIPEETTMRLGGWSDFQTMRKIYTHLAEQDVKKHTDALKNFFKAPG